jgi:hypothetical protein
LELAIKKFSDLPCLIVYQKIPISEWVLPPTLEKGMLHREAKKNLNRQALLGFFTESISIRSDLSVQSYFYVVVHALVMLMQ